MLKFMVAGRALLLVERDGVQVRRDCANRQSGAGQVCFSDQLADQVMSAFRAFILQHRVQCVQPLLCFLWIVIR